MSVRVPDRLHSRPELCPPREFAGFGVKSERRHNCRLVQVVACFSEMGCPVHMCTLSGLTVSSVLMGSRTEDRNMA